MSYLPEYTTTQTIKLKRSIRFMLFQFFSRATLRPKSKIGVLWTFSTYSLALICLLFVYLLQSPTVQKTISPLVAAWQIHPLKEGKKGYQVYGYAPYWTFDKLGDVDFKTLTTFAYFGVPVDANGDLVKDDPGYDTFVSDKATAMFQKAHDNGTKVNLTITQMDNDTILAFLDSPDAQQNAIHQVVQAVKDRGIDGVSVDYEYVGDPGADYRAKFTGFVSDLRTALRKQLPQGQVTVAVYALSAHDTKMYDIANLAKVSDSIFMMAYDFAVAGSDNAAPTAPLYGYKEGKYSYDISTAVDDFLKIMPADKLVLGVPYYGYNYAVYQPKVNSETLPYWAESPATQTYTIAKATITPTMDNATSFKQGWDNTAKVGWEAYQEADTGNWRMIFLEDTKSLGIKYDFAKSKGLAGVGMWALGFDEGHPELWALLREKFGEKLADANSNGLLYK